MRCPNDDLPLRMTNRGGYELHECGQCRAAFLAAGLPRGVRAHVALAMHRRRGDAPGERRCPADGQATRALQYEGIAISACPQCAGLWLENAALARLLEKMGPPRQADLSNVGRSLATADGRTGAGGCDGIADMLELSVDVLDGIGRLLD